MTAGIEPIGAVLDRRSWGVDRVRADDEAMLADMFRRCSAATVYARFFGRPSTLPRDYLAGALAGRPDRHDALVVRYGDGLHVVGLASLVNLTGFPGGEAELGVLVADGWQRLGLGSAMVELLLARAVDRGVERVEASVLRGRSRVLRALGGRIELERLTRSAETVTGVFRLTSSTGDPAPPGPEPQRRCT